MRVERAARLLAKKELLEKTCSSSFCGNNDEDLKMLGLTPI